LREVDDSLDFVGSCQPQLSAQLTQGPSFQGSLPHHAQVSQLVYISLCDPSPSLSSIHNIYSIQSLTSSLLSSTNSLLRTPTQQLNINNNGWWLVAAVTLLALAPAAAVLPVAALAA
jgi:hypothetical protein